MRMFIEVLDVNGEHILSRRVSFDGGMYDLAALSRFYTRLDDAILGKELPGISLEGKKSKTFTIMFDADNTGEYKMVNVSDFIRPTSDQIIADVCSFFGVEELYLKSPSRREEIVRPRQIASMLLWLVGRLSIDDIGTALGGQHHATILHSIKVAVPSYWLSKTPRMMSAMEYFSLKYSVDINAFIYNILHKSQMLVEIRRDELSSLRSENQPVRENVL